MCLLRVHDWPAKAGVESIRAANKRQIAVTRRIMCKLSAMRLEASAQGSAKTVAVMLSQGCAPLYRRNGGARHSARPFVKGARRISTAARRARADTHVAVHGVHVAASVGPELCALRTHACPLFPVAAGALTAALTSVPIPARFARSASGRAPHVRGQPECARQLIDPRYMGFNAADGGRWTVAQRSARCGCAHPCSNLGRRAAASLSGRAAGTFRGTCTVVPEDSAHGSPEPYGPTLL